MVETVSSYERKDLEFFKVFLPEFSSHELVIPPAFIDILEKPLPNEVSLLDEIGRVWCVETKTQDTEERFRVVFDKGWNVFAKDQSLEFGDFLVFNYDGDSRFSVTIYANDGIKKDLGITERSRVSVDKEPVDSFTKPERRKDCGKKRPVDSFTKPERRKDCGKKRKRKQDSVKEEPIDDLVENEPEYFSTSKAKRQHREKTRREDNRVRDPCGISSRDPEKKQRRFEEPKNPHFLRNITDSSLQKLEIPITFLKSNGIELEEDIELCDDNGKKWPMKIVNYVRGVKFSSESWVCFCKSHKLMKTTNKFLFEFIVASNGRCNEIRIRIVSGRLLTTMTKSQYQVLVM
ncbi:hypothetical protein AALP_AA3G142000 [Arabis alpina]|uniref:TF-B3 domain-containing protein n=1 Tax=Arabis alpina TaxID=50452 RepID=A0A087H944_ARAAL|nr:hypothetical protein AALP_AA3G142000 [Arabis alpina]